MSTEKEIIKIADNSASLKNRRFVYTKKLWNDFTFEVRKTAVITKQAAEGH